MFDISQSGIKNGVKTHETSQTEMQFPAVYTRVLFFMTQIFLAIQAVHKIVWNRVDLGVPNRNHLNRESK